MEPVLGKRTIGVDPVKAQGILSSLVKKEEHTAKEWHKKWNFFTKMKNVMKQEALEQGLTEEEYENALKELSCKPNPAKYPVKVLPSPSPYPINSNGLVGWRHTCNLEQYGRLCKSQRDYPIHPPLPKGQVYDPFKQTFIYLGIDCPDPISYQLKPQMPEVSEEVKNTPKYLDVDPIHRHLMQLYQNEQK